MEIFTSYHHIISPLGFNSEENYSAVLANKLGVKKINFGKLNNLFCLSVFSEENLNTVSQEINNSHLFTKLEKLSIFSIQQVLNKSAVSLTDKKTLLIYSTTKGNIDLFENQLPNLISKKRMYLSTMANEIGNYFGAVNKPLVVSNACISGLLSIIIAKRFISSGQFDNVIVCGGDLVSEFTVSGFKSFNALSVNPCKPFDAKRDGINLGEAVATILITKNKNLKTNSSMNIVNGASANDANHISGPSRNADGLVQAIQNTLKNNSEIKIDFINAHGTATPYNDEMESVAFERAALSEIPANSFKCYYGHTLGAAGVLETILSIEAARHGQIIKSAGFETSGVSGKMNVVKEYKTQTINSILKTASGFGGCNAAALFVR